MSTRIREWEVSADWGRDLIAACHEQLAWHHSNGIAPDIKLRMVTANNPLGSAVKLTHKSEQACLIKCDLLMAALAVETELVHTAKRTLDHYMAWRWPVPDAPLPCGT